MTGKAATEINAIEIRLSSIDQLFHTLDPSPFREKDFDKDVEDFIVSWARELHTDLPFTIVVHLPEKQLTRPEAKEIGPAITGFFAYSAQEIGLELKELLRVGRRSLAIGIAVLVVSIVASQTVAANLESKASRKALSSSPGSLIGGRSRSSSMNGGRSLGGAAFIGSLRQRRSSSSLTNAGSRERRFSRKNDDVGLALQLKALQRQLGGKSLRFRGLVGRQYVTG